MATKKVDSSAQWFNPLTGEWADGEPPEETEQPVSGPETEER